MKIDRIFVYGSLMKDYRFYKQYLEGKISNISYGKTHGTLYHLPEGYPALVDGDGTVQGEIMEPVDGLLLADLDKFEGYTGTADNNLYIREKRTVLREDGKQQECWVYIYANKKYAEEKGITVADGNWRRFISR
jgi:gamma-glutamylcyclotransferase (GGCT)/AIG2-like uncharacterized protein YtfP